MNVKLVLYKRGNFYRCSDEDSYILAYLLDYKIAMTDNSDMAGFPINNLDKVLEKFDENKINYIVYDSVKDGIVKAENNFGCENRYEEINENAYEYIKSRNRIDKIYKNLKEKLYDENINEILTEIEIRI